MFPMKIHLSFATWLVMAAALLSQAAVAQSTGRVSPSQPGLPATMTIEPDSASIKFIHSIQVAAQADGLIQELLVDEGQNVSEGQELLKIDARVAEAELRVAQKEAEAAAQKAAQEANIEYAKAAFALAQEELEAEQRLWEQASTTLSSLRRKTLERDRARFSVDVATVEHNQDVVAAAVAKEKVNAAQIRLELYSVKAPFDAVVAERLRDRGEWIRAGDPVLRLVHMNEVKVEALVPVQGFAITALHGAPISIQVKINPTQVVSFDTHIDFVAPEVRVNRVRVAARVKNPKVDGIWLLREGMNATCQITVHP
ncbi:MAG: HlyD family efflux transporter periplasmic adaptor subunit [Planctomycetota bacterium]|nr:MAG: HlyD family efflux transporter periplasmic adaptor subunit [Planctomycetota bacterium]